jgi:hypothetical protein
MPVKKAKRNIKKQKPQPEMVYISNEPARKWMWLLVITFAVCIFVLWGWSYKTKLASFNWQSTPESKIIANGQNDWDQLFREAEAKQNKEILKQQIDELIKQMPKTAATATGSL